MVENYPQIIETNDFRKFAVHSRSFAFPKSISDNSCLFLEIPDYKKSTKNPRLPNYRLGFLHVKDGESIFPQEGNGKDYTMGSSSPPSPPVPGFSELPLELPPAPPLSDGVSSCSGSSTSPVSELVTRLTMFPLRS